jgi:iron complex outermembrane receptor protein
VDVNADSQKTFVVHLYPLPIQYGGIVVTGEHHDSHVHELQESMHTLRGKDLQRELGQTLAVTLGNETGIAIRSMGPAPARPVIRGLGGDRIQIMEDGAKTNDLSATSPDHAVTVEPFTIERIEVLRGPIILLHTPTTIGGLVSIVRDEIPPVVPARVNGSIGVFGETANSGKLASAVVSVPYGNMVARGEVSRRSAADIRTPVGILNNSSTGTTSYSLGASHAGAWGLVGASYREYDTEYGVPGGFVGAHPNGVDITLFRQAYAAKTRWRLESSAIEDVLVEVNRTYYRHKEFESNGLIGAEFRVTNISGRTEIIHKELGPFDEGTWGVSFEARNFEVGGFVFTPRTSSIHTALFGVESFSSGPFDFQLGGRLNLDRFRPGRDDPSARIGHIRERRFVTFSFALSSVYHATEELYLGGSISRSSRVPTIEELYSEGPHLAAYSYEVGNPDLRNEHGLGLELFCSYRLPWITVTATGFLFDLPSYIITRNTGMTNFATLLPIYAASSIPVTLRGFEAQLEWKLTDEFSASTTFSYTHGRFPGAGEPLPSIPPMRGSVGMAYSGSVVSLGASVQFSGPQHRVDVFEQPTAGYAILGVHAQYGVATDWLAHNISLSVDNIFDKEYRNHLSRVKSIMPEAGRNLRIIYRVLF